MIIIIDKLYFLLLSLLLFFRLTICPHQGRSGLLESRRSSISALLKLSSGDIGTKLKLSELTIQMIVINEKWKRSNFSLIRKLKLMIRRWLIGSPATFESV